MYIDKASLKKDAKLTIVSSKFKVLLVATLYLLLMLALNIFAQNLSGYAEFVLDYAKKIVEGEMITDLSVLSWPQVEPVAIVIVLCILIMRMIVRAGYINYILLSARGLAGDFKNLLDGFYFPVKVVLMETVKYVLIIGGLMFFILPGVWFFYMFRLNLYILFDNPEKGALWCLGESMRLMRGRKLEFFMLDVSFIGWYLLRYALSLVSIPVVDIWVSPYTELTYAGYYNKIIGWQKAEEVPEIPEE